MPSQPPQAETSSRTGLSASTIRWQYRPLVDAPWLVGVLVLTAILVRLVILYETQRELDAAFAGTLVLVAGWRSWMPTKFELGPVGFRIDTFLRRKRIAWRDIERIEVGRAGVFLMPPGSSWGWWRGLYIPWLGRRDDLLAAIRQYGQRLLSADNWDLPRNVSATGPMVSDAQSRPGEPVPRGQ